MMMKKTLFLLTLIVMASSCKMSYSFRTASIDYELTKTLMIAHFVIRHHWSILPSNNGSTRR